MLEPHGRAVQGTSVPSQGHTHTCHLSHTNVGPIFTGIKFGHLNQKENIASTFSIVPGVIRHEHSCRDPSPVHIISDENIALTSVLAFTKHYKIKYYKLEIVGRGEMVHFTEQGKKMYHNFFIYIVLCICVIPVQLMSSGCKIQTLNLGASYRKYTDGTQVMHT